MKVAVLSDTFGYLPKITKSYDIVIHCGNICPLMNGDIISIDAQMHWLDQSFCPWLKNIDSSVKVVCPGWSDNALSFLEPNFAHHIDGTYLRDESATFGKMIFHATPWVYPKNNFIDKKLRPAFCARNRTIYDSSLDKIPDNVNFLITRIPPLGILDKLNSNSIGDESIKKKMSKLKELRFHVFGSASDDSLGMIYKNEIVYINACTTEKGFVELTI